MYMDNDYNDISQYENANEYDITQTAFRLVGTGSYLFKGA
jgi:hypothetical protein